MSHLAVARFAMKALRYSLFCAVALTVLLCIIIDSRQESLVEEKPWWRRIARGERGFAAGGQKAEGGGPQDALDCASL